MKSFVAWNRAVLFAFVMAATACGGGTSDDLQNESTGRVEAGAPIDDAASPRMGEPSSATGAVAPAGDAAAKADAGPPVVPNIDSIPWQAGANVGAGVSMKDTGNPAGENIFIAYAGSSILLSSAQAWATALYKATLQAKGVRYIWAVQGPQQSDYSGLELGNDKLAQALVAHVSAKTRFILVSAHSAGSFVSHELFHHLAEGYDPQNVTRGKIVYFNLDGGASGAPAITALTPTLIARMHKAYFVVPYASTINTYGIDTGNMNSCGASYGGEFNIDSNGAGCHAGASYCLHMSLVITKPHNPDGYNRILDYTDFAGRPVTTSYLAMKTAEAGLTP